MTDASVAVNTRQVHAYVTFVVAVAASLATAALVMAPGPFSTAWFGAVIAATAITEMPLVMRRIGRQRWGWGLSEAIVAVGMFVLGPGWLMIASGGGALLGRYGRREPLKQMFNAGQQALAAGGAALVAMLVAPDGLHIGAAALGMAFYFLINNTLVAVAVARSSGSDFWTVLSDGMLALLVGWAANTSLGLVAIQFLDQPWHIALLVFPLIPAHAAYYSQVQRAEEERALRMLFEFVTPPEAGEDAAIGSILTASINAFEATRAQILIARPGGSVRWQTRHDRDDVAVLVDELTSTLLLEQSHGQGVHRLKKPFGDLPHAIIAPLQGLTADQEALLVIVEDEGRSGFSRGDERIAETFASRAAERLRLAQLVQRTGTLTEQTPSAIRAQHERDRVRHLHLL